MRPPAPAPAPAPRYSYLPGAEGLVRVPPTLPDPYERSWVAVKQSTVPGNQNNINIIKTNIVHIKFLKVIFPDQLFIYISTLQQQSCHRPLTPDTGSKYR